MKWNSRELHRLACFNKHYALHYWVDIIAYIKELGTLLRGANPTARKFRDRHVVWLKVLPAPRGDPVNVYCWERSNQRTRLLITVHVTEDLIVSFASTLSYVQFRTTRALNILARRLTHPFSPQYRVRAVPHPGLASTTPHSVRKREHWGLFLE